MSKIYVLLNQMYAEINRMRGSGTPEKYWKKQLKAIEKLQDKLDKLSKA